MDQKVEPERYWGVTCLHCGKPFPVPFKPAQRSESEANEMEPTSRCLFLAWCPACNREAPYSVAEMARFEGPRANANTTPSNALLFERAAGAS